MSRENLIKCFCEARKSQALYTKCLPKATTKEEKDLLMSLVETSAATSEKIREFCKNSSIGG
ncbi:hypothetical protein D479_09055 [Halobacillus sp. BAB-2008]|nr:hypothetical protein D479_09055 [Halobacillus sp. BAB-2008]